MRREREKRKQTEIKKEQTVSVSFRHTHSPYGINSLLMHIKHAVSLTPP